VLLLAAEADVGQFAIVQGGEVLARAPAYTPGGEGGDEDGPQTILPWPRQEGGKTKRALHRRVSVERHSIFPW